MHIRPALAISLMLYATLAAAKAPPFSLTPVEGMPGGGCVGETRVFRDMASVKDLADRVLNPEAELVKTGTWKFANGKKVEGRSFVLTTVGCGADKIAVGIDGKGYLLDQVQQGELGEPVSYLKTDDASGPKVKVEAKEVLREVYVKETECRMKFRRVRVSVEFGGAHNTWDGTSVNGCP